MNSEIVYCLNCTDKCKNNFSLSITRPSDEYIYFIIRTSVALDQGHQGNVPFRHS